MGAAGDAVERLVAFQIGQESLHRYVDFEVLVGPGAGRAHARRLVGAIAVVLREKLPVGAVDQAVAIEVRVLRVARVPSDAAEGGCECLGVEAIDQGVVIHVTGDEEGQRVATARRRVGARDFEQLQRRAVDAVERKGARAVGATRDRREAVELRHGELDAAAGLRFHHHAQIHRARGARRQLARPQGEAVAVGCARGQTAGEGMREIVGRAAQVGGKRRRARRAGVADGRSALADAARSEGQAMRVIGRVAIAARLGSGQVAHRGEVSESVVEVRELPAVRQNDALEPPVGVADEAHRIAVRRNDAGVAERPFHPVGKADLLRPGAEVDARRELPGQLGGTQDPGTERRVHE